MTIACLELEVLEARKQALESEIANVVAQYHHNVAYDDEMVMELTMADLAHKRDSLAAEIAQKRLLNCSTCKGREVVRRVQRLFTRS